MALSANNVSSAISSVFETGTLKVKVLSIDKSEAFAPPKPLLIFTPIVKGEYPVVVFLHGFSLEPSFYTQLLTHVSTHGYIVVAPQLYNNIFAPSGPTEIDHAFEVTNWLPQGLQTTLPENIHSNLLKLALVGHSRGGKTAFSLALEGAQTSLNFNALIGIDPVAGMSKERQLDPKILTNTPQSLKYGSPVMLIGTGLGHMSNWFFPPSSPHGVNHKDFYYECRPPCYYFVTKDYGHLDMLDDHPKGLIGWLSNFVCKNGDSIREPMRRGDSIREPMRRCVGGLVVAFVKACFDGQGKDFEAIVEDPGIAPTKLYSCQTWSKSF